MELKVFILNSLDKECYDSLVTQFDKWANEISWKGDISIDNPTCKAAEFFQIINMANKIKLLEGYALIILNSKNMFNTATIKEFCVNAGNSYILYDEAWSELLGDLMNAECVLDWHNDVFHILKNIKNDISLLCKKTKHIMNLSSDVDFNVNNQIINTHKLSYSKDSINTDDMLPLDSQEINEVEPETVINTVKVEEQTSNIIKNNDETSNDDTLIDNVIQDSEVNNNKNESDMISFIKKEEIPFEQSREVQKHVFSTNRTSNKTIAVWSPIQRSGVTTFCINYACFLAENRLFTGVLESLRPHNANILKHIVKRYSALPKNWVSYAQMTHKGVEGDKVATWYYKDALFLPLDDNDSKLNWTYGSLATYVRNSQTMDVTIIDMPSGYLEEYSLETIRLVDELWILIDDTYQEILSWRSYIKELEKNCKVEVRLIFNKEYSFSQKEKISKHLDYPIIASIPAMHEQIMKNYYENEALFYIQRTRSLMYQPFVELTNNLLGNNFKLYANEDLKKKGSYTQNSERSLWHFTWEKLKSKLKA